MYNITIQLRLFFNKNIVSRYLILKRLETLAIDVDLKRYVTFSSSALRSLN